jgi:biotin synthase-like enzyme
MSTQKDKIRNVPLKLAKRRIESLITEVLICKELEWNIGSLSSGYDAYTVDELKNIIEKIVAAYGKKVWLNIGLLNAEQIKILGPFIDGICGSIECLDEDLHDKLCPSKPLKPIIDMLDYSKSRNMKTAITIIIGLGESIEDYALLKDFIIKHMIDRITFYALNPHESGYFTKGPDPEYYARWIAKTRIDFPNIEIIAGSWVNRLSEINMLLKAGANNITKFPSTSMFGSGFAKEIENQIMLGGRRFQGSMTRFPDIDWDSKVDALPDDIFDHKLKSLIKSKILSYKKMMIKKKK